MTERTLKDRKKISSKAQKYAFSSMLVAEEEKKPTGNAFKGPNLPFTYTDTNKSVKDDSLNLDGKKKTEREKNEVYLLPIFASRIIQKLDFCNTKFSGQCSQISPAKVCQLLQPSSSAFSRFLDDNYSVSPLTQFSIQVCAWKYQFVAKRGVHRISYLVIEV